MRTLTFEVRPAATLMALGLLMPGLAGARDPAPADCGPLVTVYVAETETLPRPLLPLIQADVEELMRPAGIRLEWRHLDLSGQGETVCSLLVLRFKGSCQLEGDDTPASGNPRLGWTHVTDGAVLPFCGIDCDLVRRTVATVLRGRRAGERGLLFARALARVAAHEFYHILAATLKHSDRGLAQPRLSASDLIGGTTRFDQAAIDRVRRVRQGMSCVETGTHRDRSANPR